MPKPTPAERLAKELAESPAIKELAEAGRRMVAAMAEFARQFNAEMERARRQRLAEEGRRLASEREDLIAGGADPADLVILLHPGDERTERLWDLIGNVPVRFWICPIEAHRHGYPEPPRETVRWIDGVAHCMEPGCGRTSADDQEATDG